MKWGLGQRPNASYKIYRYADDQIIKQAEQSAESP